MYAEIKEKLIKLDEVVNRFSPIIGKEAEDLREEYHIFDANELSKQLTTLEDECRLLQIGIIGKVKAGKSSLLNSVFFDGDNVLPKAATPMTASLTKITYGDRYIAHIEYFTASDIESIHNEAKRYEVRIKEKEQEIRKKYENSPKRATLSAEELQRKVRRQAEKSITNESLIASADQYRRMQESGRLNEFTSGKAHEEFTAEDRTQLMCELQKYVGSDGPLMPFTKSVELQLPAEELRDIAVVDTPGLNDPVASRSQRTSEYLRECDVVFIVSPAGQFLSNDDTNLMDQLSNRQGTRELYLVASQADNQLYGDIGERCHWDLNQSVTMIRSELSTHAREVLEEIQNSCPETAGQFDQLIKECDSRVIITSSVCNALARHYDTPDAWDGVMQHVHGLLQENYQDYFNNRDAALVNLKKLDGIDNIIEAIAKTRTRKNDILESRLLDFLSTQEKNTSEYMSCLKKIVLEKINKLEKSDIDTIKKEKQNLELVKIKATSAVDDAFDESVDKFKGSLRTIIDQRRNDLFGTAKDNLRNAESSETRTRHWTTRKWIFFTEEHSENYQVTTIRAGAVRNQLCELRDELQQNLLSAVESCKSDWKKDVQRTVIRTLRESVEDESLIDITILKAALAKQVGNMIIPALDFSSCTFKSNKSGKLEDDAAESFISEAQNYISELRTYFINQTNMFIRDIENSVKNVKISESLFMDIENRISAFEKDLEDKEGTISKLQACLTELEG